LQTKENSSRLIFFPRLSSAMDISKAPLSHQKHYSIILLHSQEKSLPEDPYLMSEQKDMILENFQERK